MLCKDRQTLSFPASILGLFLVATPVLFPPLPKEKGFQSKRFTMKIGKRVSNDEISAITLPLIYLWDPAYRRISMEGDYQIYSKRVLSDCDPHSADFQKRDEDTYNIGSVWKLFKCIEYGPVGDAFTLVKRNPWLASTRKVRFPDLTYAYSPLCAIAVVFKTKDPTISRKNELKKLFSLLLISGASVTFKSKSHSLEDLLEDPACAELKLLISEYLRNKEVFRMVYDPPVKVAPKAESSSKKEEIPLVTTEPSQKKPEELVVFSKEQNGYRVLALKIGSVLIGAALGNYYAKKKHKEEDQKKKKKRNTIISTAKLRGEKVLSV